MSTEKKRSFIHVNEEDFIAAIKEHPALYDCTSKEFRKYNARAAAWTQVAKKVNLTEYDVKKRWRSLRDSFVKHVKQYDEESRGQMLHYNLLKFLTPYVTGKNARKRSANKIKSENIIYIRNDSDGNETSEYLQDVSVGNVELVDVDMQELSTSEGNIVVQAKSFPKRETVEVLLPSHEIEEEEDEQLTQGETYTIEEKPDNTVEINRSNIMETQHDAEEKFLLSLAPTLRRLPTKKNTLARIKIQQLLFELEFDEKC